MDSVFIENILFSRIGLPIEHFCLLLFLLIFTPSNESASDAEQEEGEIEEPVRKSRVDPKDIPEVTNRFLMRASSKDAPVEEDDGKNKKQKRERRDSNRREFEDKAEPKRYLSSRTFKLLSCTLQLRFNFLFP